VPTCIQQQSRLSRGGSGDVCAFSRGGCDQTCQHTFNNGVACQEVAVGMCVRSVEEGVIKRANIHSTIESLVKRWQWGCVCVQSRRCDQ